MITKTSIIQYCLRSWDRNWEFATFCWFKSSEKSPGVYVENSDTHWMKCTALSVVCGQFALTPNPDASPIQFTVCFKITKNNQPTPLHAPALPSTTGHCHITYHTHFTIICIFYYYTQAHSQQIVRKVVSVSGDFQSFCTSLFYFKSPNDFHFSELWLLHR